MQHYLVTGGAGFIGSNLIKKLLSTEIGIKITCIDNYDPFYSREIKELNIAPFKNNPAIRFLDIDISTTSSQQLATLIKEPIDTIIHLAAKAGVRPSILAPELYLQVNVIGLQHLLDFAVSQKINQFIFASSSSVYGINEDLPWKEDNTLLPITPYAMTKLAGEMLGHVYHKLYGIRFIALRFFTVYGPGQRPDLAIHKFTRNILNNIPIPLYGDGSTSRDYTFVDDVVAGIEAAIRYKNSGYETINLGNNYTVSLKELINSLELILNKKAVIRHLPNQLGDLPVTYADISKSKKLLGYEPQTNLITGLSQFATWVKNNPEVLSKGYRDAVVA